MSTRKRATRISADLAGCPSGIGVPICAGSPARYSFLVNRLLSLVAAGSLAVGCYGQIARHSGSTSQVGTFRSKILLEDGTPLPHEPLVMVMPNGQSGCRIHQIFGNGTLMYSAWSYQPEIPTDACTVEIRLEGIRTKRATLHEGAVISLKRLGDGEGVAVPASSLQAPKPAVKAYGKGVDALRQGKWAEAEKQFQQAVSAYPEYAQAYSDLGEVLERQSKAGEAIAAYEKALALSPRYLKPYAQLAHLALAQGRNQDAIEITQRAIKLNPIDMPSVYYYNALANYELRQYAPAEESAKQAVELDVDKQMPRASFLLGTILEHKGDTAAAVKAFEGYVDQSPKPGDADEVKARIARLKGN